MGFSSYMMPAFILFELVFTGLVVAMHFFVRRKLPDELPVHVRETLDWGAFRIATIHALLMTLGFTEVRAEFNELRNVALDQAVTIQLLLSDMDQMAMPEAQTVKALILDLKTALSGEEWDNLGKSKLSPTVDKLFDEIAGALIELHINPELERQSEQYWKLLHHIKETRSILSVTATTGSLKLFWVTAAIGFLFTTVCFLSRPAGKVSSAVIGMFAALNGAVLFGIIIMSNPFFGILSVQPVALDKLQNYVSTK